MAVTDNDNDRNVSDDELIAYLDGELADGESADVEARLATEPGLKGRADQFARTWDALDILSRGAVSEGFTEKTLQEVSIDLSAAATCSNSTTPRRLAAREWRLAAVCFLAGVAGAALGVGRPSVFAQMTSEEWNVVRGMQQYHDGPSLELLKSVLEVRGPAND